MKLKGHLPKLSMSSIAPQQDFRLYLEKSGFVDSIVKALIQLYEEQQKPEDVNQFIASQLTQELKTLKDRVQVLEKVLVDHSIEVPK